MLCALPVAAFAAGETHVLVSTTVIEVGVDVPNATLMIVMDADRFGLSQLHQLRGRVGRGEHQSYCILIADPKSENGQERMRAMTDTDDGFEISRRDLEIRGPGEFFGTKQSGMPEFRLANLMNDFEVLEQGSNVDLQALPHGNGLPPGGGIRQLACPRSSAPPLRACVVEENRSGVDPGAGARVLWQQVSGHRHGDRLVAPRQGSAGGETGCHDTDCAPGEYRVVRAGDPRRQGPRARGG